MPDLNQRRCLIPKCRKPSAADCRGLCMVCFSDAKKAIESGVTSWEELERLGMIEAKSTPFLDLLRKRRSEDL